MPLIFLSDEDVRLITIALSIRKEWQPLAERIERDYEHLGGSEVRAIYGAAPTAYRTPEEEPELHLWDVVLKYCPSRAVYETRRIIQQMLPAMSYDAARDMATGPSWPVRLHINTSREDAKATCTALESVGCSATVVVAGPAPKPVS